MTVLVFLIRRLQNHPKQTTFAVFNSHIEGSNLLETEFKREHFAERDKLMKS